MRRIYERPTTESKMHNRLSRTNGYTNIHTRNVGLLLDNDSIWEAIKICVMSIANFDPFLYANIMKRYVDIQAERRNVNHYASELISLGSAWVNYEELAEGDIAGIQDEMVSHYGRLELADYEKVLSARIEKLEIVFNDKHQGGFYDRMRAQWFIEEVKAGIEFRKDIQAIQFFDDVFHVWYYDLNPEK